MSKFVLVNDKFYINVDEISHIKTGSKTVDNGYIPEFTTEDGHTFDSHGELKVEENVLVYMKNGDILEININMKDFLKLINE